MRAEPPRLLQIHREASWTMGDGRFLLVTASSTTHTFLGTVFDTPDGIRFDVRGAATLADAEAARVADPRSGVLAVRPSWSFHLLEGERSFSMIAGRRCVRAVVVRRRA